MVEGRTGRRNPPRSLAGPRPDGGAPGGRSAPATGVGCGRAEGRLPDAPGEARVHRGGPVAGSRLAEAAPPRARPEGEKRRAQAARATASVPVRPLPGSARGMHRLSAEHAQREGTGQHQTEGERHSGAGCRKGKARGLTGGDSGAPHRHGEGRNPASPAMTSASPRKRFHSERRVAVGQSGRPPRGSGRAAGEEEVRGVAQATQARSAETASGPSLRPRSPGKLLPERTEDHPSVTLLVGELLMSRACSGVRLAGRLAARPAARRPPR